MLRKPLLFLSLALVGLVGCNQHPTSRPQPKQDVIAAGDIGSRLPVFSVKDLQGPFGKAHEKWPIEAEAAPDALDVLRRGLVAGNNGGRIARRNVKQGEDEQGDERHDGDGCEHTPDDKAQHGLFPQLFWQVLRAKGAASATSHPAPLPQGEGTS